MRESIRLFAILAVFAVAGGRNAVACTESATPIITGDASAAGNQISIQWKYSGNTFCIFPPDFYQVRWTFGEGPNTESQSPRIETSAPAAGFTLTADPRRLIGFIVQACKSGGLFSGSNCTGWSPMRYFKPFGPAMCRSGFVWREAFANDLVCVTPQTRDQVKADNQAGPARKLPNGRCTSGFVWRAAGPGDLVCVTPDARQQAKNDNAQARNTQTRILP